MGTNNHYLRQQRQALATNLRSWFVTADNRGLLKAGAAMILVGCFIFYSLAKGLFQPGLTAFDERIGSWLIAWRSNWLTPIVRILTNLGSTTGITGVSLLVSLISLRRRAYRDILTLNGCVLGALGLSEWFKFILHRSRPPLPWLDQAFGYSFPSGHTMLTLALYGCLAYLTLRAPQWSWRRGLLATGLLLLPVLVGISRVYLGVHYPSDVIAGWAIASAWLGVCIIGREIAKPSKLLQDKKIAGA